MHYVMMEDLYDRFGGKFRFSVLLQKRVRQLVQGERPLVPVTEKERKNPIAVAVLEAREGKIWLDDGNAVVVADVAAKPTA
jgi:DNA-directed RNA polymerase subunit K/omega